MAGPRNVVPARPTRRPTVTPVAARLTRWYVLEPPGVELAAAFPPPMRSRLLLVLMILMPCLPATIVPRPCGRGIAVLWLLKGWRWLAVVDTRLSRSCRRFFTALALASLPAGAPASRPGAGRGTASADAGTAAPSSLMRLLLRC